MVIEAIDADAAQIAMTAPWSADNRAVRAQAAGFKLIEQFDEVETRVTLQGAWVGEPDPEPKHHGKTEQALAAVEKPVREVAHSENVVRGELQEHKRQAHQGEVADQSERRLLLLLERVLNHQTVAHDAPLVFEDLLAELDCHFVRSLTWLRERDVVDGLFGLVVKSVAISSLEQKLLDSSGAMVVLVGLHG